MIRSTSVVSCVAKPGTSLGLGKQMPWLGALVPQTAVWSMTACVNVGRVKAESKSRLIKSSFIWYDFGIYLTMFATIITRA